MINSHLFNEGDILLDRELRIKVTVQYVDYQNGWYYMCSLPNGAVGYRYEHELESVQDD